jgi:hypothetical protein
MDLTEMLGFFVGPNSTGEVKENSGRSFVSFYLFLRKVHNFLERYIGN